MSSAILSAVFITLVVFNFDAPLSESEAKPRSRPTVEIMIPADTSTADDTQAVLPAIQNFAAESISDETPPPPVVRAGVTIDATAVRHAVNKGNFGGKIMKELDVYSLHKNLEHLKKIAPGFWTWAQAGPGSNYRWDTHEPVAGGYEGTWPVFSLGGSGALTYSDEANQVGLEYWQATDIRHCAFMRKVAGTDKASITVIFRDSADAVIARDDIHHVRFDFKVDADIPFKSPDDGRWCLMTVESGSWNFNYKVFIRQDMRLEVLAYSTGGTNQYVQNMLKASSQFTSGEWHTLEVYYVAGSKNATAAYYLDGVRQDIKTGLDTSSVVHTGTRKINVGCLSGRNAEGKVYIDAIRAHNTYIGVNPGNPKDFIRAMHFDSSATTVDDFLYYAEQAGVTPIVQAALYPPNTGHDYLTAQFSADLVEYITGVADADYAARAKQLDFTHNTPSDNWANLRAARGRVQPYNVIYFTMGNEPYWAEAFPKDDPSVYANMCCQHAAKMKETNPAIKIGVFMYDGPGWDKAVLTASKNVLDWVCVQHDYSYEQGVNLCDQIPRLLGIPAARAVGTGKPHIRRHTEARARLKEYLAGRSDLDTMITCQDEHGFCLVYPPGQGADLGYAIYRLGYRLETIEQSGPNVWDADWLLINDRSYTYGVIGSDSLTPSYWAYRLFYEHFGSKYLNVVTDSPLYKIASFKTGAELYDSPLVSAYASLSDSNAVMKIIVINRSQDKTISVDFNIQNFIPSSTTAKVYKLGGEGKGAFDNNLQNPNNIVIHESQMTIAGPQFTYTAEPLSITAIEIDRYAPPKLSVRYLSNGNVELSWTTVTGAKAYVLQWGNTAEQPLGGTAKYPGGLAVVSYGNKFYIRMDPSDLLYAVIKARFADGSETGLSNVVRVKPIAAPANVYTKVVGTSLVVSWDAVSGAAGYRICWGTSTLNLTEYSIDAGSATIRIIYPGIRGSLYLTVYAYDENGIVGPASQITTVEMP